MNSQCRLSENAFVEERYPRKRVVGALVEHSIQHTPVNSVFCAFMYHFTMESLYRTSSMISRGPKTMYKYRLFMLARLQMKIYKECSAIYQTWRSTIDGSMHMLKLLEIVPDISLREWRQYVESLVNYGAKRKDP